MIRRPLPPPWDTALVLVIALHSVGIFVLLTFFTEWGLRIGGWPEQTTLFFARQAGVFHLVMALGYVQEWKLHRDVRLMLLAKAAAVVFLGAMMLLGYTAWTLRLSLLGDAAMGLAAAVTCRRA